MDVMCNCETAERERERDEDTTDMSLYDAEDLRDRIGKLRILRVERKREKEGLCTLIASQEQLFTQLRQELSVLAPNEDLRWQTSGAANERGSVTDGTGSVMDVSRDTDRDSDRRYRMLSDKLEMQILIAETRQALPALERDVRVYEAVAQRERQRLQRHTRTARLQRRTASAGAGASASAEDDAPSLLKDAQTLESELELFLESAMKKTAEVSAEIERESAENERVSKEIAALRRELHLLSDERHSLNNFCTELDTQFSVDVKRAEILKREFLQARERLGAARDGLGWQSEAFERETGSVLNKMQLARVPKVLSPWLLNLKSSSPSPLLSLDLETVTKELKDLSNPKANLNRNFSVSADPFLQDLGDDDEDDLHDNKQNADEDGDEEFMIIPSEKTKPREVAVREDPPRDEKEIDFTTFCLLATKLIDCFEMNS